MNTVKNCKNITDYIKNNLDEDLWDNFNNSETGKYYGITEESLKIEIDDIISKIKNNEFKNILNFMEKILDNQKLINNKNLDLFYLFLKKRKKFLKKIFKNNTNLKIFVINYVLYFQKTLLKKTLDNENFNDNKLYGEDIINKFINRIISFVFFDLLELTLNDVYILYKKLFYNIKFYLYIDKNKRIKHFFRILTGNYKFVNYKMDDEIKLKHLIAGYYGNFLYNKRNEKFILNFLHALEKLENEIDENTLFLLKEILSKKGLEEINNLENSNNRFVFTLKDYFNCGNIIKKYLNKQNKEAENFSLVKQIGETYILENIGFVLLSEMQKKINKFLLKDNLQNIKEENFIEFEEDLKNILQAIKYEMKENLVNNPGNYKCGGKSCLENKELYQEIQKIFFKVDKKKKFIEKEIEILKNIVLLNKKFEKQKKEFIYKHWRIKENFENFQKLKLEIDKIKLLGNKNIQNKKIIYLLNKMLKSLNADNFITSLLYSDSEGKVVFIELKKFLNNLDSELSNILEEYIFNNKNKSLLIQYEKFKIFKNNLKIIEELIIKNNIKNEDIQTYPLYNKFFKNIIDLNIMFKFSKKNKKFLKEYTKKLEEINSLKDYLLVELKGINKVLENNNWEYLDNIIYKPVAITPEDKIQPEKIGRKKKIVEDFISVIENNINLLINKEVIIEAVENITNENERNKVIKKLEQIIPEKKYIKEIFYQLELKKEENFLHYSNKLFLETFKKYNLKHKIMDNELEVILEDLIEEIIKLYSKNNILMEELTLILSVIKNEPVKFKNLYQKVKEDNSILPEEKLTYFIYLLKSEYELNFNASYEEFKENPKKYAKGYSGEIDRIIYYKGKNKIEGYDVTFDKNSIMDNKNNETRMYQIIRHFIQLMLLKKEKNIINAEYNFLANFNINDKNKYSEILYKLNNQLFLAFIKDDHINYEEIYFYILIDKYIKSNPTKNFKTVEELIDTINKNYLGENYTYKDFRNLIKINNTKKEEIKKYLKENFHRLNEILNDNLLFKLLDKTNEIKNVINTKINNNLIANLTPDMANEIVSNISNFYTFIKYSKLNITPLMYIRKFELPIDDKFIDLSLNNFVKNMANLLFQLDNYLIKQQKKEERKKFEKKFKVQVHFYNTFAKYKNRLKNFENIKIEEKLVFIKEILNEIEILSFDIYQNQTIRHSLNNRISEIKEIINYIITQLKFKKIENKLNEEKFKLFVEKLETKYNKDKIDFKKRLLAEIRNSKYINIKLGFLLDKKIKEYYLNYDILHPNQKNFFKNKFFEQINTIQIFNLATKMIKNKYQYWNIKNKEVAKEKLLNALIYIKKEEIPEQQKILKIFKIIEQTSAFKNPEMANIIIYKTTNEIIEELNDISNVEKTQNLENSLDF